MSMKMQQGNRVGQVKNAANMTVEEFAHELRRIRERALYIPTIDRTRVNRPKHKQMRGKAIGSRY